MLYVARQGFHLDVAFMCHSVLSGAHSLSKSLTLAHCLSSGSPHQCKFMILHLIQNEYRAPLNVPDWGLLIYGHHLFSSLSLWSVLLFSSSLPPRLPFFTLLFSPTSLSTCPSSFHPALPSTDTLNQGVIDDVSTSPYTSVNSLTLVRVSHCLLCVMSWAMQEAILSPQFHPSAISKMSTPRHTYSHPCKDEIPDHSLCPPTLAFFMEYQSLCL